MPDINSSHKTFCSSAYFAEKTRMFFYQNTLALSQNFKNLPEYKIQIIFVFTVKYWNCIYCFPIKAIQARVFLQKSVSSCILFCNAISFRDNAFSVSLQIGSTPQTLHMIKIMKKCKFCCLNLYSLTPDFSQKNDFCSCKRQ